MSKYYFIMHNGKRRKICGCIDGDKSNEKDYDYDCDDGCGDLTILIMFDDDD